MTEESFIDEKKLKKYQELWGRVFPGMTSVEVHRRFDKNVKNNPRK